jgi:hypothetical protein
MKYLSRATQANVAILLVVMRWLQANGPASYDDLAAAVRPSALVPQADDALRATLDVAAHIGLLGADNPDDEWTIVEREQPADAFVRHDLFRALVRRAILGRAVRDREAGEEPSDVAIGLTWLCSLDPSRPLAWGWGDGPERIVRSVGLTDVITNETQWRAFRRWATALGFATASRPAPPPNAPLHRLIPDPTTAIAECLPQMPPSLTAREFVDVLSTELPTVDGGLLERVLHESGVRYEARGEATLGPAVGHALERLQRRGVLTLHKSDDARQRVSYRIAGQTRTFDLISIEVTDE